MMCDFWTLLYAFYFSVILFSFLWSLGMKDVVEVWIEFFGSPSTENYIEDMKAEQLEKLAKLEDWCKQILIITFSIRICILPIFFAVMGVCSFSQCWLSRAWDRCSGLPNSQQLEANKRFWVCLFVQGEARWVVDGCCHLVSLWGP